MDVKGDAANRRTRSDSWSCQIAAADIDRHVVGDQMPDVRIGSSYGRIYFVAGTRTTHSRLATIVAVSVPSALSIAIGVVLYLKGTGHQVETASLLSMFAGLAGVILAAWQLVAAMPHPPAASLSAVEQLKNAASVLSETVTRQWEREATVRSLRQPSPLQVPWSATKRNVSAPVEQILRSAVGGRPTRLKIQGRLSQVIGLLDALPRRQLVVIGEPGAGKTVLAMLLTLEILSARDTDDPVPVMLPVLSWNPSTIELPEWIAQRISEDYPALRNDALFGRDAPDRLVISGRILPVLDGLDEIPLEIRPLAIREIARAWGGKPLVLTCRSIEYEDAVLAGRPLSGAAVVELEPVPVEERLAYLRDGQPLATADPWKQIAAVLRAGHDEPIMLALSTPLMIGLARVAYDDNSPSELLDRTKFPSREAIELHLLDQFLPRAYHDLSALVASGSTGGRLSPPRYQFEQVRAWLAFLATDLTKRNTRDFAWWMLFKSVSWNAARAVFIIIIGIMGVVVAGTVAWLSISVKAGEIAGAAVGVACAVTAAIPAFFGSIPDLPVRFNVHVGFARNLRESVGTFVAGALVPGLGVGLISAYAIGPVLGILAGSLAGVAGSLLVGILRWSLPADRTTSVDTQSVLRADRHTTIVHWFVSGMALGTIIGIVLGRRYGLTVGVTTGFISGVNFGVGTTSGTAYAWYSGTRVWLALRGHLPWRLMLFLDDAHKRGVLRQTGAIYQFRHGRLQDRLTSLPDKMQN